MNGDDIVDNFVPVIFVHVQNVAKTNLTEKKTITA